MNLKCSIAAAAAIFLCSLLLADPALADVVVCQLEEAMRRLEDYNRNLNAELAREQMPVLTTLQTLTSKAKNPGLPTGAQLTKADQDRFQQLREQLLTLQARGIVNSGYLRDSRVITRAAKVAYDMSQGRTYDEKDPDFFYYSIVGLLSIQRPRDQLKVTTPNDKECSIEAGLYFDEQLMFKQVNELPFTEAVERLNVIAQRYRLDAKRDGWAEKIPNLQDQQAARRDMGTVNRGGQMLDFVNNIENLKALAHVSLLGFQSDMEDIRVAHNEEELSKIGLGWTERAKAYDERTQILAGLLNMIAQKVPSDSAIEAQRRNKELREQGIIK
jgi:hypothetical protein